MGDYPPPTYEAASYRQLWLIVAPYVQCQDLTSACLVSREWHRSFAPQLWGNPATIFGTDPDDVQCKAIPPVYLMNILVQTHHDETQLT